MKLSQLFSYDKPTLSFEVFPPKNDTNYEKVKLATEEIARINPAYMSVTYGAGGGTSKYTLSIAQNLKNNFSITPLAHLTCVSSTREMIKEQLELLKGAGIENVLALRGDIPEGLDRGRLDYHYAYELIDDIKEYSDCCVGGACYPEGHIESESLAADIQNLKIKVDAGCDFLTTQMFFDNNILYNFLYRIRQAGITVPVVAGIMPVTNASQISRICKLSGTYLPRRFKTIVDKFGNNSDAMAQAGIAYATEQIIDLLANGVNNVHVYSMNNPEVAKKIRENLSYIVE